MGHIVSMMKDMGYLKMFGMNVNDVYHSFYYTIVNPAVIEASKKLNIQMNGQRSPDLAHEVSHMIIDSSFNLADGKSYETSWTEMQIDEIISLALIERKFAGAKVFDSFDEKDCIIDICSFHEIRGWHTLFTNVIGTDNLIQYIKNDYIKVSSKKKIRNRIISNLKKLFPINENLLGEGCNGRSVARKAIACFMTTAIQMCKHENFILTEEQEILYRRFNLHLKNEIRKSLKKDCNEKYRKYFNVGELFANVDVQYSIAA